MMESRRRNQLAAFQVLSRDREEGARLGELETLHGIVETPVFMPVGTYGAVKCLPSDSLEEMGCRIVLSNAYHLYLRPGVPVIEKMGGLHRFMGWGRSILTDSGGFQILSLSQFSRPSPEGVTFQSHIDGSTHFLSPEDVIKIQRALGSDVLMVLDDCPPYPSDEKRILRSMRLTLNWAHRSLSFQGRDGDGIFAIVQGGLQDEFRRECAQRLAEMDFRGYAIGGLGLGEPKEDMYRTVERTVRYLPFEKPRYLMGIGTPDDLVEAVARGIDLFDSVLPTRNARNGCLFTRNGRLLIKNARHKASDRPVDARCACTVCKNYSRAYLRHLFMARDMTAQVLLTTHNVFFYLDIMKEIRQAIAVNSFSEFKKNFLNQYQRGQED
jgi:queuine tRNA-ribosyltransferase